MSQREETPKALNKYEKLREEGYSEEDAERIAGASSKKLDVEPSAASKPSDPKAENTESAS